jgi:hypothetical protein
MRLVHDNTSDPIFMAPASPAHGRLAPGNALAYSLSERAVEKNLHRTLSVAATVSIKVAAP